MPATIRVLGQVYPAAATETPLYTCATTSAVVSTLVICNQGGAPDTFSIRVCIGGAADVPEQLIFESAIIPPGTMLPVTIGITLANTDVIKVTSVNGTSSFNLFGQENS